MMPGAKQNQVGKAVPILVRLVWVIAWPTLPMRLDVANLASNDPRFFLYQLRMAAIESTLVS